MFITFCACGLYPAPTDIVGEKPLRISHFQMGAEIHIRLAMPKMVIRMTEDKFKCTRVWEVESDRINWKIARKNICNDSEWNRAANSRTKMYEWHCDRRAHTYSVAVVATYFHGEVHSIENAFKHKYYGEIYYDYL